MRSAGIEVDGIAPTNGLTGIFYWYLLYPIHELMFRGMLRRIAAALSRQESGLRDAQHLAL
ncbi:MAG TPA: hypothetical protein VK604_27695 [Bryobacteraceae bacterium]|nr:hypothetical protein [Bryobacteraceae bacterium]